MDAKYWVVTDLETGGLDPSRHDIVQIARVVVDSQNGVIVPGSAMKTYVRPELGWENSSQEALNVHRISHGTALAGEELHDALGLWCKGINWEESVLASWGIDFETKFLSAAFARTGRVLPYNYRTIDVRSISHGLRAAYGHMDYLSLHDSCLEKGIDFDRDLAHDALYDAQKTAELSAYILGKLRRMSVDRF